MKKYAHLMDIIFSVKYIERVLELKTIIDDTLLRQKVCTWEEREVLNEGEIITVSSDEAFEND